MALSNKGTGWNIHVGRPNRYQMLDRRTI